MYTVIQLMFPYAILYTSPILIPIGVLLIIFSKQVANFMGKVFKNTVRDAANPFVYKIVGVVVILTSIFGFFFFR